MKSKFNSQHTFLVPVHKDGYVYADLLEYDDELLELQKNMVKAFGQHWDDIRIAKVKLVEVKPTKRKAK